MNKIIIDSKSILSNIETIKRNLPSNTKICAVIKANAYGHNANLISKILEKKANYFAVANVNEGVQLRENNCKLPILVLGKIVSKDIKYALKYNLNITITSFKHLLEVENYAKMLKLIANIHIKLNTGMNRLGISYKVELKKVFEYALKSKHINIIGIYTHFATPISDDEKFKAQVKRFKYMIQNIDTKNIIVHCSSSSGYLIDKSTIFDMVRVGIGLYGYDATNKIELKPVLSVYSSIIQVNMLNKGDFVGYDAQFIATKRTKIAVVGIGYADGIFRNISKNGYVIINDTYCKIVGKVCMDMLFVDISNCDAKEGDKVIIIGQSQTKQITAKDIANWCNTIEYEVLTSISHTRTYHS